MVDDPQSSDPVGDAAVEWFARMRDSQVSEKDAVAFEEWRSAYPAHASAYAEIEALWGAMDALPEPLPLAQEAGQGDQKWWPGRRAFAAAGVAAALYLGLWVAGPPGGFAVLLADARAPVGKTQLLTLPDGSRVTLDSGSALSWDVGARERRVTLVSGRAFFEVQHEAVRPFIVTAGDGEIRDIGTAFEVAREEGGASVAVSEGAVVVSVEDGRSATVREGQAVAFRRTLERVQPRAPRDVAAWRTGRLIYVDTPLADVIADLERHGASRTMLMGSGIGARRLTAAFDARRPDDALAAAVERAGGELTRLGPVAVVRTKNGPQPR